MDMAEDAEYRTLEYLDSRTSDESAARAASTDAHKIARHLAEQCGAVVYGIGSLFEPDRIFGPRSDIDLVAEGIPPERFLSITARAASLTEFDVDIIPLEDANELIKQRVAEYGVLL